MSAVIHDLGYQRYTGARLPVHQRWQVIMRNQIATAWQGWGKLKSALFLSLAITVVAAAVMYVASKSQFSAIERLAGGMLGDGSRRVTFAEGIVPYAMRFYVMVGFVFSLSVSAGTIAADAQAGAFTFYFVRPVRPVDYVLGKFAGLLFCTSLIMLVGPLLLALMRLSVCETTDEALANLAVLPRSFAMGAAGALLYAALPLGFSALANTRSIAIAIWAAAYILIGFVAALIGIATKSPIGVLDPPNLIMSIAFNLFDLRWTGKNAIVALPVAGPALVAFVVGGLGLAYWRVNQSRATGVGGMP